MLRSNFSTSAVTPKSVIGVSVLFLSLAAIRAAAEHRRATEGRNLEVRETTTGEGEAKIAEAENKAAKAEAELTQLQKEKGDLQSKVDANRDEIASLQKRIEEAEKTAKPAA